MINDKADPKRELNRRLNDAYVTWKRLEELWKRGNISQRLKVQVYEAVIRSKLMYGLESLQLNDDLTNKLDRHKILGTLFNEILYADDTIIYSEDAKTLSKLLTKIQTEGEK
jgi:hypothetical protein